MAKPLIYLVDENDHALQEHAYNLNSFQENFSVEKANDPAALINHLELHKNELEIALFLIDHDLTKIDAVEFIQAIHKNFPRAKKILLTKYHKNHETVQAFKDDHLDCYIIKPYTPVEEKLLPVINEFLIEYKGMDNEADEFKIVGPRWSPTAHKIMSFLSRNLFPFSFIDPEKDPTGKDLLSEHNINSPNKVLVVFPDGSSMENPEIQDMAEKAGLNLNPDSKFYNLIIVGGGPAGLAASVYASSEGLSTLVIEKEAPGGQAGTSAHIANYLGFPGGISGEELSKRAIAQAEKFGVEILRASEVKKITTRRGYKTVFVNGDLEISCHCIIICTGVTYKTLNTPGLERFTGAGVYYGAVNTEAPLCEGQDVFIVGGGNSAGQAAMYLSHFAKSVKILIMDENLESSMSHYLIQQIENSSNIDVLGQSVLEEAFGEKHLEKIMVKNLKNSHKEEYSVSSVFIFIGAEPGSEWLPAEIERDEQGFIRTGMDLFHKGKAPNSWKLDRFPQLMETSIPGIYAAGDIRSGSVKRVASAVGEGAMAVTFVHQYMNQFR